MRTIITLLCLAVLAILTPAALTNPPEQVDLSEWDLGEAFTSPNSLYICFGLPEIPMTYDCTYFVPPENTCESLPSSGWPLIEEIRSVSASPGMTCDWWIGPRCGESWSGAAAPPISSSFPTEFIHNPLIQAMGSSFRCYES
ncbi:hypothetical protein BDY19DRAFT_992750 [Irpex rosettiformis]|uniref:Uncharacterized protein n=1 Tax=Irpex rosettiformis TaxID=378272 RepID=A0ACB8U652_9APHY|nr:hypothetical protein BDY19DRAFT_992750 [Irpex rosettiformis]